MKNEEAIGFSIGIIVIFIISAAIGMFAFTGFFYVVSDPYNPYSPMHDMVENQYIPFPHDLYYQEDCENGIDDDLDYFTDCEDTDCISDYDCRYYESREKTCDDNLDNDNDFRTDCDDSDCWYDYDCLDENIDEICDDGLDNDYDRYIDCMDTECLEYCRQILENKHNTEMPYKVIIDGKEVTGPFEVVIR